MGSTLISKRPSSLTVLRLEPTRGCSRRPWPCSTRRCRAVRWVSRALLFTETLCRWVLTWPGLRTISTAEVTTTLPWLGTLISVRRSKRADLGQLFAAQSSWWGTTSRARCGAPPPARPGPTLLSSRPSQDWGSISCWEFLLASWSSESPGTATGIPAFSSLPGSATSSGSLSVAVTALTPPVESFLTETSWRCLVRRELSESLLTCLVEKSTEGRKWDEVSKTPYFDYQEGNQTYQVWYDDPQSLHIKYKVTTILVKLREK